MRTFQYQVPDHHAHLPVLSASRLALFRRCPRKFYVKYVLNIDEPPSPAATLGSVIHATIEHYWSVYHLYKNHAELERDVLQHYQQLFFNATHTLPWIDQDRTAFAMLFLDGQTMLRRYFNQKFQRPLYVEHEFLLPFPHRSAPIAYLRGFFDHVYEDGFVDLKTGYRVPDRLHFDPQMIVYTWAYEQLFGKAPTVTFIYHLRTGSFIPVGNAAVDRLPDYIVPLTLFKTDVAPDPCARCFQPVYCAQAAPYTV